MLTLMYPVHVKEGLQLALLSDIPTGFTMYVILLLSETKEKKFWLNHLRMSFSDIYLKKNVLECLCLARRQRKTS